jgi:hypothetical protein
MESAREYTPFHPVDGAAFRPNRHGSPAGQFDAVVLQVDATVSSLHGLAWLMGRRDARVVARLSDLQADALEGGWSWGELARARLKLLRPRRAEINELGSAYLASLQPGVVEAVQQLRRAGIAVALASEVAAEALFRVAVALDVSPDEIVAPRIRFDALGAYVGCELPDSRTGRTRDTVGPHGARTLFVGPRRTEMIAEGEDDAFLAFTGVVSREGLTDASESVVSFHDLTTRLLR